MAATEPPSARHLAEARKQGRVARSEALAPAVALLAAFAWLGARGEGLWRQLAGWLEGRLTRVGHPEAARAEEVFVAVATAAIPWLGTVCALLLLVVFVQRLQVGFVWASRAPAGPPHPLLQGWLTGLLTSLVALAAAALAFERGLHLRWLAPSVPDASLGAVAAAFGWTFGLGVALVVAIDVVRSRAALQRQLRMTRREVERERREAEGPREPRRQLRRASRRVHGPER